MYIDVIMVRTQIQLSDLLYAQAKRIAERHEMPISIDTNLLLYSVNRDCPEHTAAA